jgi:hypothetical protein
MDGIRQFTDLPAKLSEVHLCFRVRRHRYMVRMGGETTWQNHGAGLVLVGRTPG